MSVFILGSAEVVAAFAMGGLAGRAVEGRTAARGALDELRAAGTVQVLVVEEDVAATLREELDRWKLDPKAPLVVEVPGFAGPSEQRRTAQALVNQALGVKI